GMFIFAAWLDHNDCRSINTLDSVVEDGGSHYVRHFQMDFGSTLGSASTEPKAARVGGEYYLAYKPATKQIATLGLAVPYWAKAKFPHDPAVGGFDSSAFRPDNWLPDYPNAAFLNRLPDDEFWGAKQVMAFTDEQIRAIVRVAEFSDPRSEQYVADTIIARRDKIGRVYFPRVLPLDGFAVENGQLTFHDLAEEHKMGATGPLQVAWSSFDPRISHVSPITTTKDFTVPVDSGYLAANIWRQEDKSKTVTVYLRTGPGGTQVVGVNRTW